MEKNREVTLGFSPSWKLEDDFFAVPGRAEGDQESGGVDPVEGRGQN